MKIGGKEIDLGSITTGAKGILDVVKEIHSELDAISTKTAETTTNLSKVSGTKKNGGQKGVGSTGGNRMQNSLSPVNSGNQSSGGSTIMPNQTGMKTAGLGGVLGNMGGKLGGVIGNMGGKITGVLGDFGGGGGVVGGVLGKIGGTMGGGGNNGSISSMVKDLLPNAKPEDVGTMLGNVAAGFTQMLPDVDATMKRAGTYYRANLYAGNPMGRANLQGHTLHGLGNNVTSVGSDANVAKYLTGQGMAVGTRSDSTYQQTLRTVGNAARYLNISNEDATASVERLTGGAGSSSMLRKFGIYTSDLATGKEKTQGQIFEELANRLTAGRGSASVEETMTSLRRGNLGQSVNQFFEGDAAGAEMFKQYMIDRADGKKMDLSDNAAMKKLTAVSGGANDVEGNFNPNDSLYNLNTAETRALGGAERSYIAGINTATAALGVLADVSGNLAKVFGAATAAGSMFAKNNVVQGGLKASGAYAGFMAGNAWNALKNGAVAAGAWVEGDYSTVASAGLDAVGATANLAVGTAGVIGMGAGAAGFTAITKGMGHNYNVKAGENQGGSEVGGSEQGSMQPTIPTSAGKPLASLSVTSGFRTAARPDHDGIDYRASVGTPVYSATDGTVSLVHRESRHVFAGSKKDWEKNSNRYPLSSLPKDKGGTAPSGVSTGGTQVAVTSGKYKFTYMHLSSIAKGIAIGSEVTKGQLIGYSGDTGKTTGPHLHFRVDKNGRAVDPNKALQEINQAGKTNRSSGSSGSSAGQVGAADIAAITSSAQAYIQNNPSLSGGSAASQMMAAIQSGDMSQMQAAAMALVGAAGSAAGQGSAVQSILSGSTAGGAKTVNIELKLPDVSETEAQKFAKLVKGYLESDTLQSNMGTY